MWMFLLLIFGSAGSLGPFKSRWFGETGRSKVPRRSPIVHSQSGLLAQSTRSGFGSPTVRIQLLWRYEAVVDSLSKFCSPIIS
jgi:hypothetical protein